MTSVAIGRHPSHGDVLAVAFDGKAVLVTLPEGAHIPMPVDEGSSVTNVALGRFFDEDILMTGAIDGSVTIWGLAPERRIAAFTFDEPISDIWPVIGANKILVRTRRYYLMDVVMPVGPDDHFQVV